MHIQITKQMSIVDVDGTAVLLMDNGDAAVLNTSGSWILEKLTEEVEIDEIADAVCGRFAVDRDDALKDLHAFVHELANHEMVILNEKTT